MPRITGEAWRQIVYHGPVRRCFFTNSRSTPGMEHMVYVNQDGSLVCDCISAYYRGTCFHKSVVAAALAEEARRIAQAQAKAEDEEERGWKLTVKGRCVLDEWRKEQATSARTSDVTNGLSNRQPRRSPSGASARHQQHNRCEDRADSTPHPGDTAPLRRDNRPFSLMK